MLSYTPIQFMGALTDFLQSCPLLMDVSDVHGFPFNPATIEGNGLAYTGTPRPQRRFNAVGEVRIEKQANFIFYIQRTWIDEINQKEMADFVAQFEEWVEREDIFGRTPKFSTDIDFNEQMWADNGMLIEIDDKVQPFKALYMVQIHVNYGLLFGREVN